MAGVGGWEFKSAPEAQPFFGAGGEFKSAPQGASFFGGTDSPQSLRDSSPQRGEPLGRGRNIFRLGEEGGGEVAVAGVGEEGYYGFLAVFGAAGKGQGGVEGGAGGDAD